MKDIIKQAISEPNGKISFTRLMAGVFSLAYLIVFLYYAFKYNKIVDIPGNLALLIASLYGFNKFSNALLTGDKNAKV